MEKFPNIEGYKIEKRLGRGRLADVYLVLKTESGRREVLKVLKPEFCNDPSITARFIAQAQSAAQLENSNIAVITDTAQAPPLYYFIMEFFQESLRDRIVSKQLTAELEMEIKGDAEGDDDGGFISLDEVEEIKSFLKQIGTALDYAHKKHVIHRDLRPDNIFFRVDGSPVITDFFMAGTVEASTALQQQGIRAYLPHYAAPEEVQNQPVTPAADYYSLGVTLYEMLMGKVPYDSEQPENIANLHITAPVPTLPQYLAVFQPILDKLMAKDAASRIKSGTNLLVLLDRPAPNPPHAFQLDLQIPGGEEPSEQEAEMLELEELVQLEESEPEPVSPPESTPPPIPKTVQVPEATGHQEFAVESTAYAPPPGTSTGPPQRPPSSSPTEYGNTKVTSPPIPAEKSSSKPVSDLGPTFFYPDKDDGADKFSSSEKEGGEDVDLDLPPGQEPGDASPSQDRSGWEFKVTDGPTSSGFIGDLLDKIKSLDPKILIGGAGGLVILIVLLIFFGPFGGSGNGDGNGQQEGQSPEQVRNDQRYQLKLNLAKKSIAAGNFERAQTQLNQAEKVKASDEIKELRKEIEAKQALNTDHKAFQSAVATNTTEAYNQYLEKYPAGKHVTEAQEKIKDLEELAKKQEEELKRLTASRIKMRAEPLVLTRKEVREMFIQKNFFEKYYNKAGDFPNNYDQRTINGQAFVLDKATGLLWFQSGSENYMKFAKADEWIKQLNQEKFGGFSDWRLPTMEEAATLLEGKESQFNLYINAIFDHLIKYIWTCDKDDEGRIWALDFFGGDANPVDNYLKAYVRPVRNHF